MDAWLYYKLTWAFGSGELKSEDIQATVSPKITYHSVTEVMKL